MASPQKENGYTSISNELIEALAKIRINGEARQVLDVIFRKTYGFNKKKDRIALSQFCLATGLKKPDVCRAINKLISMEIIIKIDNELGEIYCIQKDFDEWKPLAKKITLAKKQINVGEKANASLAKKPHTKDNTTKDTETKEIREKSLTPFEESKLFFNGNFEPLLQQVIGVSKSDEQKIRNEIAKFVLYWTEPNKSGTKVRWEQESTFDVKRRLFRWLGNSSGFDSSQKNKFQIGNV